MEFKPVLGYFDLHLFGADPYKGITPEMLIKGYYDKIGRVLLVGDIVDRKNCLKDELPQANDLFHKLQNIYMNDYLTGNHEVNRDEDFPLVINGWGVCHSDEIFNGFEESKASRRDKMGRGKFSRFWKGLGSKARDAGLLNFHGKMTDPEVQARFNEYCTRYGITKGIIGGHKHFPEKMSVDIGDKKFVIYPRGAHLITELGE